MNDKEELDSWSVIINGAVRVEGGEGGRNYVLSLGNLGKPKKNKK